MTKYKSQLPQQEGGLFLTDGGIETCLIFHDKLELPYFAAFHLLKTTAGTDVLARYYARYIEIAREAGVGFILESPTWRASADWAEKLGYSESELAAANRKSIALMKQLQFAFNDNDQPVVVSGCVRPRGDGYDPQRVMAAVEAESYHAEQITVFKEWDVDMVTAITMTNINEAVGVTRAAKAAGLPVAISFTVETDGNLPTGEPLEQAVMAVDRATGTAPAYYMINCAHPTHFQGILARGGAWVQRLGGIRANASKRSHAELNEAPDLDDGNPDELGTAYRDLRRQYRHINVLGGCCGTDHRHVGAICLACTAA